MGAIKFEGLNLVASDVEATVDFYRRLGVDIPDTKVWRTSTGPHHVEGVPLPGGAAEVEFDSNELAAAYNAGQASSPAKPGTVLGFRCDSREAVDRLHADLVGAGYQSRQQPYDAFWGARYAIVADPDGRDVGLMSPVDRSRRGTPPNL